MSEHDDPELPLQKKEHEAFTKRVQTLINQPLTEANASDILDDILPFLIRWLYRHILSSDMMIGKLVSSDPFAFTAKYHTGIKEIDEEHKRLFDIIRETNTLIHNDLLHDKYDEIIHLLSELREYTKIHFSDEEAYMKKIGFPDLDAQIRAHTAFVDKLMDINLEALDEIDNHQQEYLLQLIDFLAGWLVNHILKMDVAIGAYGKSALS